ncbi:MAG: hypothetical protein ABIR57_01200, partial [Aeromicrobium sp.]
MARYWFKRRRFGYGWIPVTVEGWLVLTTYIVLMIGGGITLSAVRPDAGGLQTALYLVAALILTAALFAILIEKGPAPKWRWGRHA